jgi:hypothetical protein
VGWQNGGVLPPVTALDGGAFVEGGASAPDGGT